MISNKIESLPNDNPLLRDTLKRKGLKTVPAAKPADAPGIYLDGAAAPLHPSILTSDVFHYVEGKNMEGRNNRRN